MKMFENMWPKRKTKNTAAIGGALSLAAVLGGLITWYTARRMRDRGSNEFLYQDDESQP